MLLGTFNYLDRESDVPADLGEGRSIGTLIQEDKESEKKFTNLMKHILLRNYDIVKSIIDGGVDINACTENGTTALHVAAQEGRIEMIDLLCKQDNINLNETDYLGETPLDKARNMNYHQCASLIEKYIKKYSIPMCSL